MTQENIKTRDLPVDECISKRPWGEVLNRSLKLFAFNFAREGGRSIGQVIFYLILAAIVIGLAAWAIGSVTGWFSGWFDLLPFVGESAEAESDKWYCKWNPVC